MGASLVLAGAAVVAVLATRSRVDPGHAADARRVLDTTAALSGLAVFALCRATWRQSGDRAALWAGTAALAVGVIAATRPELVGAILGSRAPDDRSLAAVSTAAAALAPVLFAAGLVPSLQHRRFGPGAILAGAVGLVAAFALVLRAVPSLGPALAVSQLNRDGGAGSGVGGVVVAGAWLAVAVGYAVRGFHQGGLYSWAGPLLIALTLSGLAAGAAGPGNGWAVGAAVLEALGVVSALVGCQMELTRTYEDQNLRLFDSALEVETAELRERVRAVMVRDRRHDLINAVTAIDGAAMILEQEFERLSGTDRETLAGVVGSGTARLLRLIGQEPGAESRVSLAETAIEVARDPAWQAGLELDVAPDLVGAGSSGETAEAVRQLVEYAHRRAPGGPVTLRGERDGGWVVLRVEDRGPTMSRQARRAVTDTEARPVPGPGGATGLLVAARLMRAQGGDLWVEGRPGGGTSFGICLPAATAEKGDARGGDA